MIQMPHKRIVLPLITATLKASRLNVGHACYLVVCFIWFSVGTIKIITVTAASKLLANWSLSALFDTPLHHFTSPVENFFLWSKFVMRQSRIYKKLSRTIDKIHIIMPSYTFDTKRRDKLEDGHTLSKVVDLTSHLNNFVQMLITQDTFAC